MRIELLQAWPHRFEKREVQVDESACVADALRAAGWHAEPGIAGYAVFGTMVTPRTRLQEGDRVELLRSLQADPKDARRRRAQGK